ncbi:MAG TPA: BatD family protein, partial [Chitinophagaceae bacterium]|nr:BatD family protein [Chitinophagaceae bacterium]
PVESSGVSIINGTSSQYKALVYFLQPKSTGKLKIAGATAIVDGTKVTSNSVIVTVTNQKVQNQGSPNLGIPVPDDVPVLERELFLKPDENAIDKIKKNLFIKAEVNKASVFVNEPVVATYKLYSRVRSESRVVKRPSYNGFSVYDMVEPDGSVSGVESINGKAFNVHVIRQSQLFPLQAGTFTLEPVEVENIVRFVRTTSDFAGGNYDELFDPNAETVEQTLTLNSKPVKIEVKPLPLENQPSSFDGAVGNFKVEAFIEGDSIRAGDVATLNVKVKGKGNLPIINSPQIKWPSGIEAYDPETKENIHPETVPLSGEKNFKFRFTSKISGPVVIPGILFSFFDPATRKYKTDSTTDLKFDMVASKNGRRSDSKEKGIPKSIVSRGNNNLLIYLAAAVILIMGITWIVLSKQAARKKLEKQIAIEEEKRKAAAALSDPLIAANALLVKGDRMGFCKEIENAIWSESAKKLSIPSTALSQSRVMTELISRDAQDAAMLFRQLVNDCECNLYIPGEASENLHDIAARARQYISQLESL